MSDLFDSPYPNSLAVVPARMGSTRLPGKMLADLGGKPLVVRTWEACCATRLFERVLVATDHPDILRVVEEAGGEGMLTDPQHNSGSDRLAEVARQVEADLYVNVQGDEPFVTRACLHPLMELFRDQAVRVGSLMSKVRSAEEYENPSVVKVVCNHLGDALYFSRASIPYARGGGHSFRSSPPYWGLCFSPRRPKGIYPIDAFGHRTSGNAGAIAVASLGLFDTNGLCRSARSRDRHLGGPDPCPPSLCVSRGSPYLCILAFREQAGSR